LQRGHSYRATRVAALLDHVGANREATAVRRKMNRLEDQSSEDLQVAALDHRRSAEDRLESALELLKRHSGFGLAALEALLSDPAASRYERFSAAKHLLASRARQIGIATLKRVATDEPWYRVSCGTALVFGGEPEVGCAILCKVAFEPAETADERAEAIEQLVHSGRIDLAIAAFRRLWHSGDLKAHCLERIEKSFAHTSAWAEFLDHCNELLSSEDPALRIEALSILMRAKKIEAESKCVENLLRPIILDRDLPPDLRLKAARHLDEMENETVLDLVFDITTSPEETAEAGIEAMRFLRHRDQFLMMDGGHDVVWDSKLSPDQFIEAAHAFLSIMRHRHESDYEPLAEGICGAVAEALQEIAADATHPIERRFAAADLKDPNDPSSHLHDPFWPGVDAICQDEATPFRLRQTAIRYALRKDPTRIDRWRTELDCGELGHLEAAYAYLAAELRDAAAERFRLALVEETGLHVRVRIWKELALLLKGPFAGREAAKVLSDILNSGQVEALESDLLEDLLLLSRAALPTDEFIALTKAAANHQDLNAYDIGSAARALAECGAAAVASTNVEARKASLQKQLQTDDSALYELTHLSRLQAHLGERDSAAETLNDICSTRGLIPSKEHSLVAHFLSMAGQAMLAFAYEGIRPEPCPVPSSWPLVELLSMFMIGR
jgi:plasmid stability protein